MKSPANRFTPIAVVAAALLATAAAPTDDAPANPDAPTPTDSTVPADPPTSTSTTTTSTTTTTTTSTTTTTTVAATTTSSLAPPEVAPPAAAPTTAPTPPPTAPPPTTVPPAPVNVQVIPEQLEHILATIRYLESRGDYTLPPNRGNASGAYQFIASTWNNYAGYPHAYLAPPHIQDQRAVEDVQRFLEQWDNDVSMIPVMWYFPLASRDVTWMDRIPKPGAGNVLTVREYQTRWLGVFSFLSGLPIDPVLAEADALARAGLPPGVAPGTDDRVSIAFPVLGPSRIAAPDCGSAATDAVTDGDSNSDGASAAGLMAVTGLCSATPPGIVFGVKLQPVLSVTDGVVTDVHDTRGEPVSVTVTAIDGRSFTISGFNDDNPGTDDGAAPSHLRLSALATVGTTVRAGQVLGFMGDSDPLPPGVRGDVPTDATIQLDDAAIAPHIKLTIAELDGTQLDAYGPVIEAGFRQACAVDIGGWSMPPNGADHEPVVIETTDTDRTIDSEWIITSTGQVTASGWAAMTYPTEGCAYTPAEAFGPGAAGWSEPIDGWDDEIDLPTTMWLDLAARDPELPSLHTPVLR